jgi:hypothetical protein
MRLTARRAIGIVVTTLVVPVVACVLADPPASVPPTPLAPPEIDHELVVPPVTSILAAWPGEFDVPILVLDPSVTVEWEAFLDYDPLGNHGGQLPYVPLGEVGPGQDVDDAGERMLVANIPAPPDLTTCHTLEIIVAFGFENHAPNSVGGDSVTWFYSPTGSLDGCPIFDFEAGAPDAGEDGSSPVDASPDDGGAG